MLKDLIPAKLSWNCRRGILSPVRIIYPILMLSTHSVLPEDSGMSEGGYEQYDEGIQMETFGNGL